MPTPTVPPAAPPLPVIQVVLHTDGSGFVDAGGNISRIPAQDAETTRSEAKMQLHGYAAGLGRPVPVTITDEMLPEEQRVSHWWFPAEGRPTRREEEPLPVVEAAVPVLDPPTPRVEQTPRVRPLRPVEDLPDPEPQMPSEPPAEPPIWHGPVQPATPEPEVASEPQPRTRREPIPEPEAVTFQEAGEPRPTFDGMRAQVITSAANAPAQDGWRGGLRQLTGWKIAPGPVEVARRDAKRRIRREPGGPRTIAVVNPKGGASKTPTAFMLSLTLAETIGGYTLFLDNNEGRGTASWRANHALDALTVTDLLKVLDRFEVDPSLGIHDLTPYVRSGTTPFDMLAADEKADDAMSALAGADGNDSDTRPPKITAADYRRLRALGLRFYRRVVVDTGNKVDAPNWRVAVSTADQLVLPSLVRSDVMLSAAYTLEGLYKVGLEDLARNAIIVLTDATPEGNADLRKEWTAKFTALTSREQVFHTPFDPELEHGGPVLPDRLSTKTRDVWLQITAAVADRL